jgi:Rrf2 family transcriptional regulator, iron-sulfur cluster assembly transcription factor
MKISTRARYGLRGLFDIAYHNLGRPTHVKDTARRQGVTPRYLEQIFQALKREGIVAAQRGPKGGYYLAREPETITIGDVVRATEGPIRFSCDGSGKGTRAAAKRRGRAPKTDDRVGALPGPAGADGKPEITGAVWDELAERVEELLDGITLADLCARGEAEGLPREADARRIMYFI